MLTNHGKLSRHCTWFRRSLVLVAAIMLSLASSGPASADEVTDWTQHTITAIRTARASAIATLRILAIESAAVFDAVNGIEQRFRRIYVRPNDDDDDGSSRAAAIQAAYATLIRFFPSQTADLDAKRAASLAAITGESDELLEEGVEWGQRVADRLLRRRCGDGSDAIYPAFTGGTAPGQWRPTPPANASAATPELARMTPFVMTSPSQFRPAGPPALTSAQYATFFNETKALGVATGSTRTSEQTQIGLFWDDNNQIHWNRIALVVAAQNPATLSDSARLFALLNLAMSDAQIVAWDAKYFYNFWRPITAIRLAGTGGPGDADGNPDTVADPAWSPLRTTPNHQEYVSGHSTVSGTASTVLAFFFGDNVTFTHGTDIGPPTLPAGTTRTHTSFSAAASEASVSRIFTGAHFRPAATDAAAAGAALGNFVVANFALPASLALGSGIHGAVAGRGDTCS